MTRAGAIARLLIFLVCALAGAGTLERASAQGLATPSLSSPTDGQVITGQFPVTGSTDVANFASSELAFAYASDPTHTWFTIQTASLPASGETLAVWDTTSVTDGDYVLRLRVNLQDGATQDAVVNVRVMNYTALPTATPAVTPTSTAALEIPTAIVMTSSETPSAPTVVPIATPTMLPINPAGITSAEVYARFWRGALVMGLIVLGFGALMRFRR